MYFDFSKSVTRAEALNLLAQNWQAQAKTEMISVNDAIGRVTAKPLFAQYDVPIYRTSAVDGIAVNSRDFAAGIPDTANWVLGKEYARADTGDDFADEYDSIIAIEDINLQDGKLTINKDYEFEKGDMVRKAGSVSHKGEKLIDANLVITPDLASMLVLGGIRQLEVIKKPKVVFIPTGDELIYPGEVPYRGKTLESNSLMVKGYLQEFGADAYCFPIIRDDEAALEVALDQALLHGDIILINGGSSKGSEDFNSKLIEKKAQFFRHGIRAVPGRPVGVAVINNVPVINIPGPAIACSIALDWCVRGLISHYYGIKTSKRPSIKVKIAEPIQKNKDFEMYIRYQLEKVGDDYIGHPIPRGISLPAMMAKTMALFVAPIGVDGYRAGSEIEMELMCKNECLQGNEQTCC